MIWSWTADSGSRQPGRKATRDTLPGSTAAVTRTAEVTVGTVDAAFRVTGRAERLVDVIASVAGGDTAAFSELYDSTVAKVHALVRTIIRNTSDAEEVTCDIYTQVWQTAYRFDPSRGSPMAWLLTIARHRAIDSLRRHRSQNRLIDDQSPLEDVEGTAEYMCPERVLNLFQSHSVIRTALEQLSAERRRLVGLAFFEDLSHAEIADVTGLPLGTVKSHLRRAMQSLRDLLHASEIE